MKNNSYYYKYKLVIKFYEQFIKLTILYIILTIIKYITYYLL